MFVESFETLSVQLPNMQYDELIVLQNHLTPLLIAILENRENMVKFLITEKANIYAADNMNRYGIFFIFSSVSNHLNQKYETSKEYCII